MTDSAPSPGEPRRLHPATLIARWLKIVPQLAAGGIAIAASAADRGLQNFLMFAGIGMLAAAGFALLHWWRFTYAIGPREIVIEKGLLNRQRRVIPFDRVQDVAIEQRLLARIFGTAKVKIETGGSASDEGNLDMIGIGDAHALRDLVRRGGAVAPASTAAQAPHERWTRTLPSPPIAIATRRSRRRSVTRSGSARPVESNRVCAPSTPPASAWVPSAQS